MHMYCVAYRHLNDEVEGFKGYGFEDRTARQDAFEQIRRKLYSLPDKPPFDSGKVFDNLLDASRNLTAEEMEQVRRDWATNVRY